MPQDNDRALLFDNLLKRTDEPQSVSIADESETMHVVKIYQHERRFVGDFAMGNLLATDPAAWCKIDGTPAAKDDAGLPLADATNRWDWVSDWACSMDANRADEDGWRYAPNFSADHSQWSQHQSALRVIRTREWFRIALRFPISRQRHSTLLSSTEGRLALSQMELKRPSVGEALTSRATSAASAPMDQKLAALEAQNGTLQETVARLEAEVAALHQVAVPQAPQATDHGSILWDVFSKRVVGAMRRHEPVALGLGRHRAKATWYAQEGEREKAVAELERALSSLRDWATAESAMLRAELEAAVNS